MSQTDQLYSAIRESILSLRLLPGEVVTERGFEAQFGASRTPVRAALMRLQADGLVVHRPREWAVAPIDAAEITAVAEFRTAVECAGVRWAAARADAGSVAAVLDRLGPGPEPDEDASVRAGEDFHILLAQLSGNAFVVDAVRGAMTRMARTRWLEVRTAESRRHVLDDHRRIAQAVADGRGDVAAGLLEHHIMTSTTQVLGQLGTERAGLRARGLAVV